jgi:hydrogenase maturation protein HypF
LTRLQQGEIVAIKGVGGYHLAAYPLHPAAVSKLRAIKNRDQQALALMVKSLKQAEEICEISASAAAWLTHPAAPIVICPRKPGIAWVHSLSPDTHDLGLFLPYSPLHRLLLNALSPLVMTSANLRDEPILYDESAPQTLCSELTPYVLGHNREIVRPCDDSLLALADTVPLFFRRSRGFVPRPLPFLGKKPAILAFGGDRKNTFCITQENHAYVSQHLGDLSSPRTLEHYRSEISKWCDFLNLTPAWRACDMHPEYFSSQEAMRSSAANRLLRIQHHHAHLAAVLGEHKLTSPVLGVAWDGTGYGPDETLWGGEFFQLTRAHCQRLASFQLIPLPGGEAAIHTPWKTALGLLHANGMPPEQPGLIEIFSSHSDLLPPLRRLLEIPELSPRSSGAGRLFDAVAACLGFDRPIAYEGQAAIWLQTLCHDVPLSVPPFPFELKEDGALWRLHWAPMLEALAQNLATNSSRPMLAARFHATLAEALLQTLKRLRDQTGLNQVVFSGGVFQNTRLIQLVKNRLSGEGFMLYWHLQLPANDGCLSFGQAIVAAELLAKD